MYLLPAVLETVDLLPVRGGSRARAYPGACPVQNGLEPSPQYAHGNVLPCHTLQGLADANSMLQTMAMLHVLPPVVGITLQGGALLAALPPLGRGSPYRLVAD